jgi:hypothetical protein
VAVSFNVPDVPVTVTVVFPAVAVAAVTKVNVLVVVVLAALNVAVTPLGRGEVERLTLPLKPF